MFIEFLLRRTVVLDRRSYLLQGCTFPTGPTICKVAHSDRTLIVLDETDLSLSPCAFTLRQQCHNVLLQPPNNL
jgi:hypothetical protein